MNLDFCVLQNDDGTWQDEFLISLFDPSGGKDHPDVWIVPKEIRWVSDGHEGEDGNGERLTCAELGQRLDEHFAKEKTRG